LSLNLDIRICLGFSALSLGFNSGIASSLVLLAMTEGGVPLRPFLLSLRAEGAAILVGQGIAELVPSEARKLAPVCFGYASQPLVLLAMTEGGVPLRPFLLSLRAEGAAIRAGH
jgi:hypothetical protein